MKRKEIIDFIINRTLLVLSIILVLLGIIFIIGASKTEAVHLNTKCVRNVWGYCWGTKAVQLYHKLQALNFSPYQAKLIINKCKKFERLGMGGGAKNCVIAVAGIATAESGGFKHCYKGQCMGVKKFGFQSLSDNLDDWLRRYSKYRYTRRQKSGAAFFYSINGHPSPSRYCTEEASSGYRRYHCINGYRHFNYVFYFLSR